MTLKAKDHYCQYCKTMHPEYLEEGWCDERKRAVKTHREKMKKLELTDTDKVALRLAKIEVKEYWAVVLQPNGVPVALFDSKGHAELWKNDNWRIAFIEPYNLQIK